MDGRLNGSYHDDVELRFESPARASLYLVRLMGVLTAGQLAVLILSSAHCLVFCSVSIRIESFKDTKFLCLNKKLIFPSRKRANPSS